MGDEDSEDRGKKGTTRRLDLKNRFSVGIDKVSQPWLVAFSAMAIGLMAEFSGDRIMLRTKQLGFLPGKTFDPITAAFWYLLAVWIFVVFARSVIEVGRSSQMFQSMVSKGLARVFSEWSDASRKISENAAEVRDIRNTLDPEELETDLERAEVLAAITRRIVDSLKEVAHLAALYAGRSQRSYGANMMVCVEPEGVISLEHCHHLAVTDELKNNFDAMLFLPAEWWVPPKFVVKGRGVRDFAIPAMREQFAKTPRGKKRRVALPGAPEVYCTNSAVAYDSIDELIKEAEHFDELVKESLREHFEKEHGRGVQSFLSIPLGRTDDNGTTRPIGMLNVDCTKPVVLNSEKVAALTEFWMVVRPLTPYFTEMLRAWEDYAEEVET